MAILEALGGFISARGAALTIFPVRLGAWTYVAVTGLSEGRAGSLGSWVAAALAILICCFGGLWFVRPMSISYCHFEPQAKHPDLIFRIARWSGAGAAAAHSRSAPGQRWLELGDGTHPSSLAFRSRSAKERGHGLPTTA